jgi:hypothetical protein
MTFLNRPKWRWIVKTNIQATKRNSDKMKRYWITFNSGSLLIDDK